MIRPRRCWRASPASRARWGALLLGAALAAAPHVQPASAAADSAAPLAAPPGAPLAFVHVEGNVGGASGGHVALRLGERAWHLRLAEGGVLRLDRLPWDEFVFRYAILGNRPLHVAWVALPEAAALRLEDGLTARWLDELEAEDAAEDRRLDRRLLEALAGEAPGVPVRAAGLLDPARRGAPGAAVLRRRAEDALGPRGLAAALPRVEAALAKGPGRGTDALLIYREKLALRAALRALREGHPLAESARVDPARAGAPRTAELGAAGRAALASRARALEAEVAALLASPRPDRGQALLVAIARHRAVSASLERGALLVVDPLADGPVAADADAVARRREELAAVAARLAAQLERGWPEAVADGRLDAREAGWLEAKAGRAVEAARAVREGRPLRAAPEPGLPSRARLLAPPPEARIGARERARLARRLEEAERLARARRAERAYQLLLRNCATELARSVVEALGGRDAAAEALGGRLVPGEDGSFVPFLLQRQVRARLRVVAEETLPSWREAQLARLRAREPDLRVHLRESNVWSSSLYAPRDRDGTFLFFTDQTPWLRPLQGLVNLTAGVADAALGVATLPFDGGRRLVRAGRGILFSAPELVFANVRKGSFDAASLPPDAGPEDLAR